MTSYTLTLPKTYRPYPASDVHVTGTFDDWGKSEQLNKVGEHWEKVVTLSSAEKKILYKFVVDDQWVVDENAPKEDDGHNNVNNVLLPEQIKKHESAPSTGAGAAAAGGLATAAVGGGAFAAMSSVSPDSTTAQLAGQVPKEETAEPEGRQSPPGAFPETPAHEPESFSVKPIPATGAETVDSTATTSKEDYERAGSAPVPQGNSKQPFSATPIPATGAKDLESTATTSKEDYEKAGSAAAPSEDPNQQFSVQPIPATGAKDVESSATTSKADYEKAGTAALGVAGGAVVGGAAASAFSMPKEEKKNIIPESSLPMDTEKVDSMDKGPFMSSAAPESTTARLAGAVPLEEKKNAVPESSMANDDEKSPFTSSAAPESTTAGLAGAVPLEKKRQGMVIDPADAPKTTDTAPSVPEMVKESLHDAHQQPEAAASSEAVQEKSEVEKELLGKVKSTDAAGEPASAADAQTSYYGLATAVPPSVEKSMQEAKASPEATSESSAVAEKALMEKSLLEKVHKEQSAGEPAPATAAATSSEKVPGTSSVAGAAVADGTAGTEAAPAAEPAKTVEPEKTEGDATEYAPPKDNVSLPGVAPSAAAAVSDGADPTLADEPAVKMMNQHATATSAATETAAETKKDDAVPTAGPMGGVVGKTEAATGSKKDTVPTAGAKGGDVGTAADKTTKATTPSSASTPAKKATAPAANSPATSSTKEAEQQKKKRHRISGFFKKIFD